MFAPASPGAQSLDTLDPNASFPERYTDDQPLSPVDGEPDSKKRPSADPEASPSSSSAGPPPYSLISPDPESAGVQPPAFFEISPQTHRLRNGKLVSHDGPLNRDAEALYQWLSSDVAHMPPKPAMEVKGTHRVLEWTRENGKLTSRERTVTDFCLLFDLYWVLPPGEDVRRMRLVCVPPSSKRHRSHRMAHVRQRDLEAAMDIRAWCEDYVLSTNYLKEFWLRKVVVGLDEPYLREHMELIVRSTNYRGRLEVSFPTTHAEVVLTPGNLVSRMRYGWMRWFFYLTFLWLLTWPVLWILTRKWQVVDAEFGTLGGVEKAFLERWGQTIRHLVRNRRQMNYITIDNLKWVERNEVRRIEEEEERREVMGGASSGPMGWVRDVVRGVRDGWEGINEGWGGDAL